MHANEQRLLKRFLELPDLPAYRGLSEMQFLSRACETQAPGCGFENMQGMQRRQALRSWHKFRLWQPASNVA
ncbi:hypothetical protein GCM10011488_07970 [Steroidobacter agaridevorans]|nr:hypothetical protein GCM10011488_07970 [Steroidobacter agaridevorans]